MDEILKVSQYSFHLFGHTITVNPTLIVTTWVFMGVIGILCYFATRKLTIIPGTIQSLFELAYEFIENLSFSSLGEKSAKKFLTFFLTIFLFVLLSNWGLVFPNIVGLFANLVAFGYWLAGNPGVTITYHSLFSIEMAANSHLWFSHMILETHVMEPTRSLNTNLALALIVFFVAHTYGIRKKGFKHYAAHYMGIVPARPPYSYFFFLNPFFYLEIVSRLSGVLSHSFRLFGNIFGGVMIVGLVSMLLYYLVIPIGLLAYFGLVVGFIQAFVFTTLAVTYVASEG